MRPSRLMYADGWASSERHQRQHFLFVGGALLALLFVAGVLPQPKKSMGSAPNLPVIRIHYELLANIPDWHRQLDRLLLPGTMHQLPAQYLLKPM